MTVIRPNSISGVSSITGSGGDVKIFRADGTAADVIVNNITSGVITATTFSGNVTGNVTGNLSGGTINATSGTITGNLGVGGVLTYEDVTNVDSVGVITARSSINIHNAAGTGIGVTINSGGINVAGVITATSFSGIDSDKISEGNTEVETVDTGSDGHVKFTTEGTERLRIHANGRIEPKYSSSAGATGGIIMVGAFCAQPSAHSSQEGKVQAKTNTNVNTFDASGWYDNTNYRYNPKVKGHYIFFGTGMMYTGMNGSSVEQSVYFVKNDSAGSGSVPQYATGYSTNYGNYDLNHITNCIYMNGTTDYVHFHLSSSVSPKLHSASMWQGFLLYPAA